MDPLEGSAGEEMMRSISSRACSSFVAPSPPDLRPPMLQFGWGNASIGVTSACFERRSRNGTPLAVNMMRSTFGALEVKATASRVVLAFDGNSCVPTRNA